MPELKPSELERKILSVLWEHGPLTVRAVRNRIPDNKTRAYTTILSTMQVMERKGLLTHRRDGTAHVFEPLVDRADVMKPFMGEVLRTVFGGRPSALLQCLLDDDTVNEAELTEIRRVIREHARRSREQRGES